MKTISGTLRRRRLIIVSASIHRYRRRLLQFGGSAGKKNVTHYNTVKIVELCGEATGNTPSLPFHSVLVPFRSVRFSLVRFGLMSVVLLSPRAAEAVVHAELVSQVVQPVAHPARQKLPRLSHKRRRRGAHTFEKEKFTSLEGQGLAFLWCGVYYFVFFSNICRDGDAATSTQNEIEDRSSGRCVTAHTIFSANRYDGDTRTTREGYLSLRSRKGIERHPTVVRRNIFCQLIL